MSEKLHNDYKSKNLRPPIEVMKEEIERDGNGMYLKYAWKEERDNEEFVRFALSYHGASIMYASPRLQNELEDFARNECPEPPDPTPYWKPQLVASPK